MKFELLDDILYIEYGQTMSDYNYGNRKLSIRIATRTTDPQELEATIDGLKDFVNSKLESWKSEREQRREALENRMWQGQEGTD